MTPSNVYFIGAGGIGMAALERHFMARGLSVAGYDRTPSELTHALQAEGAEIVFDDDPALIPQGMRNPADTLVVRTPAVPDSHRGLQWFRAHGFEVVKRAEALGHAVNDMRLVGVAGTHGKTTVSAMTAHILTQAGPGCNAFLGGVVRNYSTNYLLAPESNLAVAEADEFDRSFHHLRPTVAVVTSTDPDHLDIYGTPEAYREAYAVYTSLIRPGGTLIRHAGIQLEERLAEGVDVQTYSATDTTAHWHALNLRRLPGKIIFDLRGPDGLAIDGLEPGVPVEINVENTVAAVAAAYAACPGLDPARVARAVASFEGAKRRFEFWIKEPGLVLIDDYGHHPREVEASIRSVKALYPHLPLTVAFQPHLYSRTRDFAEGFARALSQADRVVLVDLYPAREEPIEGVSTRTIGNLMSPSVKLDYSSKENLPEMLKNNNFGVVLTLGAGDICDALPRLAASLRAGARRGADAPHI